MSGRGSLVEGIRNAKVNLDSAEQSFKAKKDVRGELDLMLAEAEMENLKRKRSRRVLWTRQILAVGCALLVCVGGYGGWVWAHSQIAAEASANAVSPPLTAKQAALPGGRDAPAVSGNKPAATAAKTVAAAAEKRPPVSAASVRDTAAPAAQETIPSATAPRSSGGDSGGQLQLSAQQMHQLVRSGRQTLNSSK